MSWRFASIDAMEAHLRDIHAPLGKLAGCGLQPATTAA